MVFFSFAHWRFVFSKVRRTVYGIFLCALGRTFVFSLHTKKPKKPKTKKPLKIPKI